jgi:DNA-binding NtrC family response regulator
VTDDRTLRREVPSRTVATVRVHVEKGPDAGREVAQSRDEGVTVGTAEDNDLHLSDRTVSRYHLELSPTEAGVLVRDVGSLNGTWLGRVRLEQAVVPAGTELVLGDTTVRVHAASQESASASPTRELPGLVAASDAMRRVVAQVDQLAATDVSVLVTGETGTGKEVVAHALHDLSSRSGRPFVVVDCGSLPATLVASELFGHERGAFTGADRQHVGAFERADGGTIFLDEIGELPMQVQPALLGALERRRFRRVGGRHEIAVDVRVISATHRDLRAEVNRDAFRADLYYRLAVARVLIPPLRERPEDVEALVRHFVTEITGDLVLPFGAQTLEALRAHRWSGNVRELRNVVEAAVAMGEVRLDATRPGFTDPEKSGQEVFRPYKEARAAVIADFEKSYLSRLIADCEGNASEASRRASMDRQYLLSLLRRHGLR